MDFFFSFYETSKGFEIKKPSCENFKNIDLLINRAHLRKNP